MTNKFIKQSSPIINKLLRFVKITDTCDSSDDITNVKENDINDNELKNKVDENIKKSYKTLS